MFDELKKYKKTGHFFFKPGDKLSTVSADMPDSPGVYCVMRLANDRVDLVYIGKSETINNDRFFSTRSLRDQINKETEDEPGQSFFEAKCKEERIEALDIYWYVTMDKTKQDLPGYVQAIVLQTYFDIHGRLPAWNTSF